MLYISYGNTHISNIQYEVKNLTKLCAISLFETFKVFESNI